MIEEEVQFLREKVNQLENLIWNINKKFGVVLDKLLNHRANKVSRRQEILREEEDLYFTLISQLKAGGSGVGGGTNSGAVGVRRGPAAPLLSKNRFNSSNSGHAGHQRTYQSTGRRTLTTGRSPFIKRPAAAQQQLLFRRTTRSSNVQSAQQQDKHGDSGPEAAASDMDFIEQLNQTKGNEDPLQDCLSEEGNMIIQVKVEPKELGEVDMENEDEHQAEDTTNTNNGSSGSEGEEESMDDEDGNQSGDASGDEDDDDEPDDAGGGGSSGTRLIPIWSPRSSRRYTLKASFATGEEAATFIQNDDNQWALSSIFTTLQGKKHYYKCRNRKCCMHAYFLIPNDDESTTTRTIDVYINEGEHHHGKVRSHKYRRFSQETKDLIYSIFTSGVTKPSEIFAELKKLNQTEQIGLRQLESHVKNLREKMFGDLSFMKVPVEPKKKNKRRRGGSAGGGSSSKRGKAVAVAGQEEGEAGPTAAATAAVASGE